MSADALGLLCSNDWPGNVRALESCIRTAVANHPDVEYLYPLHFDVPKPLGEQDSEDLIAPRQARLPGHGDLGSSSRISSFEQLLQTLSEFCSDEISNSELNGALPKLREVYALFSARLLAAGLKATALPTPENPEGETRLQPAIRLLLGDPTVLSTTPADEVKRILHVAPEAVEDLVSSDQHLRDAYKKALHSRPLRGKEIRKTLELRSGRMMIPVVLFRLWSRSDPAALPIRTENAGRAGPGGGGVSHFSVEGDRRNYREGRHIGRNGQRVFVVVRALPS